MILAKEFLTEAIPIFNERFKKLKKECKSIIQRNVLMHVELAFNIWI